MIDKHDALLGEPFSWRQGKDRLFIAYEGREVMILRGEMAAKTAAKLQALQGEMAVQLALAKLTGNFKRGNERLAAEKRSKR